MNERAAASRGRRVADLVVLLVLAGLVVFYCVDAVRASTDILNLMLVLPLSIAVLALCLVQFALSVSRRPLIEAPLEAGPTAEATPVTAVLPMIGLFATYVLTLPWLGFDVGTCVFLAAFLGLKGERRWPWLLGYSLGFGFALALFFSRMLPYAMPMLLLGGPG